MFPSLRPSAGSGNKGLFFFGLPVVLRPAVRPNAGAWWCSNAAALTMFPEVFARKILPPCLKVLGARRKTITKSFSCKNKSFILTTKSFIYTAKTFSYRIAPAALNFVTAQRDFCCCLMLKKYKGDIKNFTFQKSSCNLLISLSESLTEKQGSI